MDLNSDFYHLTQSLWTRFFQGMATARTTAGVEQKPRPQLYQLQAGRAESPGWLMVQAEEFDPEPLTVDKLRRRATYSAPRMIQAILDLMTAENWLDRREDRYALTEIGRELINNQRDEQRLWLSAIESLPAIIALPADSLTQLENLLARVLAVAIDSPTPPGSWCLRYSQRRKPPEEASVSAKLLQHIIDLNAFRDDAHMAAWEPTGMTGYEWEAFAFIAAGNAETAVDLSQQLGYRGYSRQEYSDALHNLVEHQWLTVPEGARFSLTKQGEATLANVEQLTDQYFYAPWREALSEEEIKQIPLLIKQVGDALKVN